MTEPYLITPVGACGVDESRACVVYGPDLDRPSYADLLAENRRLRARCDALTRADVDTWAWRDRYEDQTRLRIQAQDRLARAMRVLAVIAHVYPRLRLVVERARKDIWGA